MYGLLTKCEVKMAGYWPSSFFACLWTETKSTYINLPKIELGQYPPILTAGSPERARWLHLARSGSQSQRAIWFILPAHGVSHIIKVDNVITWLICIFKKRVRGQYPAILTEQTWSIKDLLCGFRENFSCGVQRVVPSGQAWMAPSRPLG